VVPIKYETGGGGVFLSSESKGEGNNPTRSENRIPGMQ
jgi:hypothetical protein